MYALSPVADDAFPSRLASLPKQRESIISHRAPLHIDVNLKTFSPQ